MPPPAPRHRRFPLASFPAPYWRQRRWSASVLPPADHSPFHIAQALVSFDLAPLTGPPGAVPVAAPPYVTTGPSYKRTPGAPSPLWAAARAEGVRKKGAPDSVCKGCPGRGAAFGARFPVGVGRHAVHFDSSHTPPAPERNGSAKRVGLPGWVLLTEGINTCEGGIRARAPMCIRKT